MFKIEYFVNVLDNNNVHTNIDINYFKWDYSL